jgi:hypothetical protein
MSWCTAAMALVSPEFTRVRHLILGRQVFAQALAAAVMWLRIGCVGDCQIHRGLNNSGVANSSARNGCSIKLALLDRLGNHFLIHPLTLVLASKGAAKYMRARHQTLAHTKRQILNIMACHAPVALTGRHVPQLLGTAREHMSQNATNHLGAYL